MLCPTRFVVDATKSNKKEAWRLKCAAPRLVYDSALFFEMFMHIRTSYVRPNIFGEKKKTPPGVRVSVWTSKMYVQKFRVSYLEIC